MPSPSHHNVYTNTIAIFIPCTVATVRLNDSVLSVPEEDADIDMCISVSDIPSEGIDPFCAIEVTINFTRVSTCKLFIYTHLK